MKNSLGLLVLMLFATLSLAQEYKDPFPDTRAPYRFRIYEREVLAAKEIADIDTFEVKKYLNHTWMQGIYRYEGDTTYRGANAYLQFSGRYLDGELTGRLKEKYGNVLYPTFYRFDTIYVIPTIEGFEKWKEERGYR